MSNTYTQIHIHAIFAVKYRKAVIDKSFKQRLFNYIIAIIERNGHKVLAIGGVADHIHIFFGLKPSESISSLIQEVKRDSSLWINTHHLTNTPFQWQNGYGAFSVSHSNIGKVANYIQNQETHHQKKALLNEYTDILRKHGISFDDNYIFKPLE